MRHTLKAVFAHRSDAGAADSGARMHARHVVTLAVGSGPDLERAVAIIERFGPLSIEDHDDELAGGGVDAGMDAPGTTAAYPPGTEPGVLQGRAHEDSRYFGTQSADSPPEGNTFKETMGAESPWVHPDDGRLHVAAPSPFTVYASVPHDDDMAAYRYGKEMHASDRYRNRSWDEAEPDLSSGWEARAAGAAAWDESRPAIRRGWDEVAPEIDDDSYYRNHWTTRYAGSAVDGAQDDDEPAYLHGSEARRSENYRSKDGRDVAPAQAAAWKARHAGQLSPWENFKDAVHHGWNRTSRAMDDAGDDADLKSDWEPGHTGNPSPAWNKLKAAVRHGWDRVRS